MWISPMKCPVPLSLIHISNLSIEGKGLTLDLSNDAVVNLLLDHKTDDSSSYLPLTSGTLTVGNLGDIAFTTALLSNYGLRITGTDGGSLVRSLSLIHILHGRVSQAARLHRRRPHSLPGTR